MASRVASVLLVLGLTLVAQPAAAGAPPLAVALDAALGSVPGSVGVVVVDLETGYAYAHEPALTFEAASLFKLYVMAAAYGRAESGPSFLESTIAVARPHVSGGDVEYGSTAETVADAIAQMIEWSDNEATAALVGALGIDQIDETLGALGLRDSAVRYAEASGNTTSARDVARFFTLLAKRELISPGASDAMTWVLLHQDINDRLPKGVPAGALIAHKTGNSAGTYHDAGILWTPFGERVVVVLTARVGGEDARALIEEIAYLSYSLPAAAPVD